MTKLNFNLINFEDSVKLIKEHIETLSIVEMPLTKAIGMYSKEAINSKIDIPPFNVSAMDGYAFKYGKKEYKINGYIHPGSIIKEDYDKAYEVGTGAVLINLDTVIPYEQAIVKNNYLFVKDIKKYENVRLKGEIIKKGTKILDKYEKITPGKVLLLAGCGIEKLKVIKKPIITIISTGNELFESSKARIYDSNLKFLCCILSNYADKLTTTTLPDDYSLILKNIKKALENSDLIITTGGVSKGKKDFVKKAIIEAGFKIIFHGVNIKPSKPLLFAVKNTTLFFGLPGNPVSSFVSTYIYVIPTIKKMMGGEYELSFKEYKFSKFVFSDKFRDTFILSSFENGKLKPLKGGSHNIASAAKATHIAFIKKNTKTKKAPAILINDRV